MMGNSDDEIWRSRVKWDLVDRRDGGGSEVHMERGGLDSG